MNTKKNMMKLTILVIIILFIGCSDNTEPTPEDRAHEIIDSLIDKDFETVRNQWFSEELKESISLNELEDDWKEIVSGQGEFIEVKSIESETRGEDIEVIEAEVEYEEIIFDVRMIFNENKFLVGFNLTNLVDNISLPDSIIEEEIIVGEGTDHELGGTLTLPKENQEKLPAVVLVHGSGPQDRDETVSSNKPFRDIAWGLAEQEIAVIRYDKRTYVYGNESVEDISSFTVYEETVEDAIRAS